MTEDPRISFKVFDNQTLPEGGRLIGQTTGRGKDAKSRLIVYLGPEYLAKQASQEKKGFSIGRKSNSIAYAIMGPAVKALENQPKADSISLIEQRTSMSLVDAEKKSSEWTWLPECFDVFKTTFLVKVDNQWMDMNASSLEKAFGITKKDIRENERDLTKLIQERAAERLQNAQKFDKQLAFINKGSYNISSSQGIQNEEALKELKEAFDKDPSKGVENYLNSLQVCQLPLLTIDQLRKSNNAPGAQQAIDRGLAEYLKSNKSLIECLMEANKGYTIPAQTDPQKAQAASDTAIRTANEKAKGVQDGNAITTTSPNPENKIDYEGIKALREAEPKSLNSTIFSIRTGMGVQGLITESREQFLSGNPKTRSIIQAASQYNGAEAISVFTPLEGLANAFGKHDRTQGPQTQLMEPEMFEIITGAANDGYNALASVLRKETHEADKQSNILNSGYLEVGNNKLRTENVTRDFCQNGDKLQSAVLKNKAHDVVLSAAPSWQGQQRSAQSDEAKNLAFAAAFYNYSALFEQGLKQLNDEPSVHVRICPTAIGCGAFSNDSASVFKAFNKAADDFYSKLTDDQRGRVKVEMQIFNPQDSRVAGFKTALGQ